MREFFGTSTVESRVTVLNTWKWDPPVKNATQMNYWSSGKALYTSSSKNCQFDSQKELELDN